VNALMKKTVNGLLGGMGWQIVRKQNETQLKPWDRAFLQWIKEAQALGKDPNDIGDIKWDGNALDSAQTFLYPYLSKDSVVIEIGPGTGRVTRHVIGQCKKMILFDYSEVVCDWLKKYLRGKGDFEVYRIDSPNLSPVSDSSADLAFAYGVFEHVNMDDIYEFLREFQRILRPGGVAWFNYDTLATQGGIDWFKEKRANLKPGVQSIFRFYHPNDMQRLAEAAGFSVLETNLTNNRLATIRLGKPVG